MAALTQNQVRQVFTSGGPRRWSLYELYGVSGNDTIDMAGLGFYSRVTQALVMPCTATPALGTPGINGAVIALPSGLANDSAYLLVDGIPL